VSDRGCGLGPAPRGRACSPSRSRRELLTQPYEGWAVARESGIATMPQSASMSESGDAARSCARRVQRVLPQAHKPAWSKKWEGCGISIEMTDVVPRGSPGSYLCFRLTRRVKFSAVDNSIRHTHRSAHTLEAPAHAATGDGPRQPPARCGAPSSSQRCVSRSRPAAGPWAGRGALSRRRARGRGGCGRQIQCRRRSPSRSTESSRNPFSGTDGGPGA